MVAEPLSGVDWFSHTMPAISLKCVLAGKPMRISAGPIANKSGWRGVENRATLCRMRDLIRLIIDLVLSSSIISIRVSPASDALVGATAKPDE